MNRIILTHDRVFMSIVGPSGCGKTELLSLCDIQQIEYLGKQLNCLQLIKKAYNLATAEPFGHFIIDVDPKTSQGLRFASHIIGPNPSFFYIPSEEAVVTSITNEKQTLAMGK